MSSSNCIAAHAVKNLTAHVVCISDLSSSGHTSPIRIRSGKYSAQWAGCEGENILILLQVLCIADINRADHQLIRGGGAACFMSNPGMWRLFSSIIQELEPCQPTCPVSKAKPKRPKHSITPKSHVVHKSTSHHGSARTASHSTAHKTHAPHHRDEP